ncbi:MAG: aldehyde dehydrogenase, partial [Hyphomicrobiaceae bacterium]|nr:aldehyde dehydrogenase [Hyphomicrobiaceae bacterium]
MSTAKGQVLERRNAARKILDALADDALIVASVGTPTGDVAAAKERNLNFYLRGAMGCASSVALGLALAQPERRVLNFVGDAELLMTAGSLATIAVMRPKNLAVVVLDNEAYGETGMQKAATGYGVDIAGIAKASGFPVTATARTESDLAKAVESIHGGQGPVLIVVKVRQEKPDRVALPYDGVWIKNRFREAL